jgi:hypothetical protein
MIDQVLEKRRLMMGKEHPYTHLAMLNKAKINVL